MRSRPVFHPFQPLGAGYIQPLRIRCSAGCPAQRIGAQDLKWSSFISSWSSTAIRRPGNTNHIGAVELRQTERASRCACAVSTRPGTTQPRPAGVLSAPPPPPPPRGQIAAEWSSSAETRDGPGIARIHAIAAVQDNPRGSLEFPLPACSATPTSPIWSTPCRTWPTAASTCWCSSAKEAQIDPTTAAGPTGVRASSP